MSDGSDFVHPDAVGANLKHTFKVICIDRNSGKILWERVAYEGPVYDSRHRKASFASSTPATDGKYVYAFFGSEGLYAYDFNGKLIWKQQTSANSEPPASVTVSRRCSIRTWSSCSVTTAA